MKLPFFLLLIAFSTFINNKGVSQKIIGGYTHSMALKADGSIVGWGYNEYDAMSVPSPNTDFVAISTTIYSGYEYTMGLKSDGSVVCWGGLPPSGMPSPNSGYVGIAAGKHHIVGLKSDGSVVCWGRNYNGQCNVPSPNSGFVAVAAGDLFSMGLKTDGTIAVWGSLANSEVPAPNAGFIAISICGQRILALKSDGSVVSWGATRSLPNPNSGFIAIALGETHALGLKPDGSVVGWGSNNRGQCTVPSPNTSFVAIAAGYMHSIGLKSDGTIVCWGENGLGECNVPSPNSGFSRVPPTPVLLPPDSYTSSSFTAHWHPTYTATGYQLDISTYSDFSMMQGQAANGSATSCTVTGLTPGILYYCRIRALNPYGVGLNAPFLITLKNEQTIAFNSLLSTTYGDAPFTVSATGGASGNPVIFSSSDNTVATCTGINGENITLVKPGPCTIYASQEGNDTYYAAQVSQTLTVSPKTLTVTITTPANKVYDGNTNFTLTDATLSGIINSEDVSLTSGSLSFADKNAGNSKPLTVAGFALSGVNAGNYVISLPTGLMADINKAPLSIGLTAQSKIYNGTTDATVTSAFTSGYVSGDDVTVSVTNGQFTNKNTGINKPVNANITISGSDVGNYIINTIANPTADITKAALVVSIAAQNKVYDGTANASATASVTSGLIAGDVVTPLATGHFDTKNAGTGKTVTADITLNGTDAGNYTCNATATNTADISKATLVAGILAQNKVYDGTTGAVVTPSFVSGYVAGNDVTINTSGSVFDNKNAGTGKTVSSNISLSGADAGNYSVNSTANATADITKAGLNVSLSAQNKVYDGNTNAGVTASIANGLISGDNVTANAANGKFDNKNAGSGKTVTADITLSGTDAGNYTFNAASATADISKAALNIGLTAQNKTYDGTTNAIASASIVSGLIAGDYVTADAFNAVFDNKNTGTGKMVAADISLSGADAGNYTCCTNGTATADILKAGLIADIDASFTSIYCKGGTAVDFTVTYPAIIDAGEGSPYLCFIGSGIRDSIALSSADNITWTCHWASPDTINGIVNLSVALQDAAGNYKQSSTGTTLLILQNTPNGISEIASNDMLIYPTVNQCRFNIAMNNPMNGKVNVRIVNLWGVMVKECQFVKTGSADIFEVSMDSAPAGEYLVEVRMNGVRELRRVIRE